MKDWKEYERNVAKALGAWWGCEFRRTPSSGAWSTQGRVFGNKPVASNEFHGDIVAPPEAKFPFSVECKAYKNVELYLTLYGKSPVFDWWEQCLTDSVRVHKWPMLVFKENNKKPLVAVSHKLWEVLPDLNVRACSTILLSWPSGPLRRSIVIMGLQQFIETLPAKILRG